MGAAAADAAMQMVEEAGFDLNRLGKSAALGAGYGALLGSATTTKTGARIAAALGATEDAAAITRALEGGDYKHLLAMGSASLVTSMLGGTRPSRWKPAMRSRARSGEVAADSSATSRESRDANSSEEWVTLYRGMKRKDADALIESHTMLSKGALNSTLAEPGPRAKRRHSWPSYFPKVPASVPIIGSRTPRPTSPDDTPYISATSVSKQAGLYARSPGDVVVEFKVPRTSVERGLNPHQFEYLIRTGAGVRDVRVLSASDLVWGPKAEMLRGYGIAGGLAGAFGTLGYVGGSALGQGLSDLVEE